MSFKIKGAFTKKGKRSKKYYGSLAANSIIVNTDTYVPKVEEKEQHVS